MNLFKHSLAVLGMLAAPAFAASQVSISIDAGKPGPVINKNVYGQFAENLGISDERTILLRTSRQPARANGRWRLRSSPGPPAARCRAPFHGRAAGQPPPPPGSGGALRLPVDGPARDPPAAWLGRHSWCARLHAAVVCVPRSSRRARSTRGRRFLGSARRRRSTSRRRTRGCIFPSRCSAMRRSGLPTRWRCPRLRPQGCVCSAA